MKKLKTALSILLVSIFCFPSLAFAGYTTGPNGSPTAGNAEGYVSWSNATTGNFSSIDNIPSTPLSWSVPGCYQGGWIGRDFNRSVYGNNTYWAATLVRGQGGQGGSWAGKALIGLEEGNSLCGDNCWKGSETLATFFLNNAKYCNGNVSSFVRCRDGYGCNIHADRYENCHLRVNSAGGEHLFAVWIDTNKLYITFPYENSKEVIVKYETTDDPEPTPIDPNEPIDTSNPFDCTEVITPDSEEPTPEEIKENEQENSKWQYYNAPIEGTYHGVTPPIGEQSHNYKNSIRVHVKKITKICSITCKPNDKPKNFEEAEKICEDYLETGYIEDKYTGNPNSKKYPTIEYKSDPIKTIEEEVKYTAETPELVETVYRPFNLNRNDYAEPGDGGLPQKYTDDDTLKLDGTVDNHQNIYDDQDLETLDINNDSRFDLKFNNNQLGMTKYDYLTQAPKLANDTWEYSGPNYANGYIGDTTDVNDGGSVGYYRHDLKLEASIGENEKIFDSGLTPILGNTSSLAYNGGNSLDDEKLSNEEFKFSTPWNGGIFGARFIINGKYSTDNESDTPTAQEVKKYWVNTYKQTRFYEYGLEYGGVYNSSTINHAEIISPINTPQASIIEATDGTINVLGTTIFQTDGLNQRGLYVGAVSKKFSNPVLYGHWNVETLAGDTRE